MARPHRISVFLPGDTPFYRALLRDMVEGFVAVGLDARGRCGLLGEAELVHWCDEHRPDAIFEMNRTRSEAPFCPRGVAHLTWIVDFLGRSDADIRGSDVTYYFDSGWAIASGDVSAWLPAATSPKAYCPQPFRFASDVGFAGHIPLPWSANELRRSVSCTSIAMTFSDLLEAYVGAHAELRLKCIPVTHASLYAYADQRVRIVTGGPITPDAVIKYDLLGRLPRMERADRVGEVVDAGLSLQIFGPENWLKWPRLAPHYQRLLTSTEGLCAAYQSARINLHEGVGMHFRALDCMASGGLLAWRSRSRFGKGGPPDLETFFDADTHYIAYHDGEFVDAVRPYLDDPARAARLRQQAAARVREAHTWAHRAERIKRDLVRC